MKKLFALLVMFATAASAEDAYVDFQTLTPKLALKMAQEAMNACEERGYQVGVQLLIDQANHKPTLKIATLDCTFMIHHGERRGLQ